jgi:hypothetical protein
LQGPILMKSHSLRFINMAAIGFAKQRLRVAG